MIYDVYYCDECDLGFELGRSIHDKPSEHSCPSCEKTLEVKLPQGFNFAVRKDPQTLGHLAERNTEGMGHYELQEKRSLDKINKINAKKAGREELSRKLPKGARLIDSSEYKAPWWRKGTESVDMSLNKLSGEKLTKYINEGEK